MKQIKELIKHKTLVQFSRFVVIGFMNTAIDFAALNLMMWLSGIYKGRWIILLNAISFVLATTNSYFWNKFWTFKAGKSQEVPQEFGKFLIISLIGIGLNSGMVYSVTTLVRPFFGLSAALWANLAKVAATGISLCWNFLGYKFIVFKK
ncbi:MAG TPA: GtrA family protein [Candidatus Portnoybacteria bacterium]|nr:GtrA family protein [Candidatus Portnoybacteria bacterium]